jgi:Flp pilus assembly protein TadG
MMNRKRPFGSRVIAAGRTESGQALIELALTLPLLFLLLLGAAEFGRLAYMAIEVSEAAKAAAQYGSQNTSFAFDTAGMTLAAQNNAPYVNANCTNFTATVPSTTQCVCMSGGSPTGSPSNATCTAACTGYVAQVLTVTTSATCSPVFAPSGFSHAGITLNGSAVQEVLN